MMKEMHREKGEIEGQFEGKTHDLKLTSWGDDDVAEENVAHKADEEDQGVEDEANHPAEYTL